jgi:hypothetical protein
MAEAQEKKATSNREGPKLTELAQVIPLVGRDEMNLIEFPLGPAH